MLRILLGIFLMSWPMVTSVLAATTDPVLQDINVRMVDIGQSGGNNNLLDSFVSPFRGMFFSYDSTGGEGIQNTFITIAFQIKNFFIAVAVIFLIIGVIKLLFSSGDEEAVKKWKSNIIWVSLGMLVMQLAFSIWNTLLMKDQTDLGANVGWQVWTNIFSPLVMLLQMLASLAFLMMAVYAFYIIVTGAGDEEKLKKGYRTIIYGLVGFFLIRLPQSIVTYIYGAPACKSVGVLQIGTCVIEKQNLQGSVSIVAKVINYLNGFLFLVCVLLVIYAGWLVFTSAGDEERLKKAKNTVLYVVIGLVLLIASHALFRFFVLPG